LPEYSSDLENCEFASIFRPCRMAISGVVRHCIAAFFILVGGLPSAAHAYDTGPVDGVVIDAANKQPIVDAIVIAKWQYVASSIAGGSIQCDHVDSVVSDSHGRYHINKWRYTTSLWDQLIEPHFVSLDVYKPGMTAVSPGIRHMSKTTAVLELRTSTVTHAQLMAWLHFLTYSSELKCGYSKDSEETLRAVREVVYTEAKSIATDSAEDQEAMMDIEQWRLFLASPPPIPSPVR
jgi:hypothetical protein